MTTNLIMWQLLVDDINMEHMLTLDNWIKEKDNREFKVIMYPRSYVVKAEKTDIENFCKNVDWVEHLLKFNSLFFIKQNI